MKENIETEHKKTKRIIFTIHSNKILNSNKTYKHYMQKANIVSFLRNLAKNQGTEERGSEDNEPLFDIFRIVVTVCPPTRRRLDPPNLYPTTKPLVDGLTDAQWWVDDDFRHATEISFRYGGVSGVKDTWKIVLDIIGLDDAEASEYVLDTLPTTIDTSV